MFTDFKNELRNNLEQNFTRKHEVSTVVSEAVDKLGEEIAFDIN